jgi:hypothetical protein
MLLLIEEFHLFTRSYCLLWFVDHTEKSLPDTTSYLRFFNNTHPQKAESDHCQLARFEKHLT